VNYLCQCTEPYRNVNGSCVSGAADSGARKPGEKIGSDQSGEPADEATRRHRSCGRGMIRTHAGCVPARRRYPVGVYEGVPPGLAGYPGEYYVAPGSRSYRLRGYEVPQ